MPKDTRELLEEWGDWVRHQDLRLSARCGLAVIMAANVGTTLDVIPMSDDEALRVDRVVAQLKMRDKNAYEVLYETFVNDLSSREIGKKRNVDKSAVLATLERAIAWIDGALSQGEFIA